MASFPLLLTLLVCLAATVHSWNDLFPRRRATSSHTPIHGHLSNDLKQHSCSLAGCGYSQRQRIVLHESSVEAPLSSSTNQTRTWDDHYELIRQYYETHGHGNVPLHNSELGGWIRIQRKHYRQWQQGKALPKTSQLTPARMELLRQVNFSWYPIEVPWQERYEELCEYRDEHGHCLVPITYKTLGSWVSQQRMQYKKLNRNMSVALTEKRIQLLNQVDFIWDAHEYNFQQRVSELRDFLANGGQLVDLKGNDGNLGLWFCKQKNYYRHYLAGNFTECKLSAEHIAILEDLGLSEELFKLAYVRDQTRISWSARMDFLRQYKRIHGHVHVPRTEDGWAHLGSWVAKVRERMDPNTNLDKASPRIRKRLEELEEIGFIWDAYDRRWQLKYQALEEFKREHSHTNVPCLHSELGLWVREQRKEYSMLQQGLRSKLSAKRVQALNDIGFEWSRMEEVLANHEQTFQDRIRELQEFQDKHGKNVGLMPQPLRYWVDRQRQLYRNWLRGDHSPLTADRRYMLESAGIVDDICREMTERQARKKS